MPDLQPIPIKPLEDAEKLAGGWTSNASYYKREHLRKRGDDGYRQKRLEAKLVMEGDERRRGPRVRGEAKTGSRKRKNGRGRKRKMTEAERAEAIRRRATRNRKRKSRTTKEVTRNKRKSRGNKVGDRSNTKANKNSARRYGKPDKDKQYISR